MLAATVFIFFDFVEQWSQELGAEATTVTGLLEEDHEEVSEAEIPVLRVKKFEAPPRKPSRNRRLCVLPAYKKMKK